MKNYYNYKTYYTGTPQKLEECNLIYLILSSELTTPLELSNLDDIKKELSSGEFLRTSKKTDSGEFIVTLDGDKRTEFDAIIYCSGNLKSSGEIIGYTLFSAPQKCYSISGKPFKQLIISIVFVRQEKEYQVEIGIKNTFKAAQVDQDIIGKKDNEYSSSDNSKVIQESEEYLKFTNRILDFKRDPELNVIVESGAFRKDNFGNLEIGHFYIQPGVSTDSEIFTDIRLGLYKEDLVLFKFNKTTGEYCLSSLSRFNRFNHLYDYLSGFMDVAKLTGYELYDYSGSTVVFWNEYTQTYLLYYMEDMDYAEFPRNNKETGGNNYIVLDKWDPTNKVRYMEDTDLFKEVRSTCFTPNDFTKKSELSYPGFDRKYYTYLEKKGEWWLFRSGDYYYYLSVYGLVVSKEKLTQISDRLFAKVDIENNDFFVIPIEFGHFYEFPVRHRVRDGMTDENADIPLDPNCPLSDCNPIIRCILDGIRRKPHRLPRCLPSKSINNSTYVFDGFMGLLFYMDNGLLYCY